MVLTDQQRQLVTDSFARLVPLSNEATAVFYNRLWEIAPETKSLFHTSDMTQQGLKLMQTLGVSVRALHNPDSLVPLLQDLSKRHIGYGVTKEQFEPVKSALLWMIEHCLESDFTYETREAWIAAYDLIATITISAYE